MIGNKLNTYPTKEESKMAKFNVEISDKSHELLKQYAKFKGLSVKETTKRIIEEKLESVRSEITFKDGSFINFS